MINPITTDTFAALFNCMPVDRASDSMMTQPKAIHFSWLGPEALLSFLLSPLGLNRRYSFASYFKGVVWQSGDLQLSCNTLYLLSPRLCFFIAFKIHLFVYRNHLLKS